MERLIKKQFKYFSELEKKKILKKHFIEQAIKKPELIKTLQNVLNKKDIYTVTFN